MPILFCLSQGLLPLIPLFSNSALAQAFFSLVYPFLSLRGCQNPLNQHLAGCCHSRKMDRICNADEFAWRARLTAGLRLRLGPGPGHPSLQTPLLWALSFVWVGVQLAAFSPRCQPVTCRTTDGAPASAPPCSSHRTAILASSKRGHCGPGDRQAGSTKGCRKEEAAQQSAEAV